MSDQKFQEVFNQFLGSLQGFDMKTRETLLRSFIEAVGGVRQQAANAVPVPEKAAGKVPPGGASSLKFGGDDTNSQSDSNNPSSQRGRYGGSASSDIFGTDAPPTKVRPSTGGVRQNPGGTSTIFSDGPDVKEAPKEVVKEVPKEPAGPVIEEIVPDSLRAQVSEAVYRKGKLKDTLSKWNQNRSKVLTSEDIYIGIKACGVDITRGHAQWFYLNFKAATPEGDGVNYSGLVRMLTVDRK